MKTTKRMLIALAVGLSGCGSSAPPPPATATAQAAKPLPNSNIFSSDVRALNKAKAVQGMVNKQKTDADKQIQDSGG